MGDRVLKRSAAFENWSDNLPDWHVGLREATKSFHRGASGAIAI